MSDLAGNPKDRFSHNEAQFICRRVAALQERESQGASRRTDIKHKGPAPGKGPYKGMSQTDVQIQQRLEKLKEKSPKEGAYCILYYCKQMSLDGRIPAFCIWSSLISAFDAP